MQDGTSVPVPALSPAEEQERWLHDAFKAVKQHAFYMKRALDENNLRDALKHSAAMLGELRTSLLSPQKYYALYMKTFDELRHLEAFFMEEHKRGRSNAELYELVQHAGNILPRQYLLITVGSVYIKSKEGAAKDVLKDLVEMARGVQHPMRGLFLRTYLSQVSKNLLPDTGSEYEGEGGTVQDAVEFILLNFTEMNKLWVRMQHQGPVRDKDRREKERQELRDLVGKNLLVLSQLEGVDLELYKTAVLPRILEQVVSCKDEIAQPYLMDAVIQVFPDEFHLQTLETLLAVCPQLQGNVKVGGVLAGLMTRLAKYAADVPEVVPQFQSAGAFFKFGDAIAKVIAAQPGIALADVVAMYASAMTFALQVHREQLNYVDIVLAGCATALEARGAISEPKASKQLVNLLSAPLEAYDVVSVLSLGSYPKVMDLLEHTTRKHMAVTIVRSVLKSGTLVREVDQVDMLFKFISLLIKDDEAHPQESELDEEDFEEEQNLVARLVHHLLSSESEEQYRILLAARRQFGQGGPKRLRHTLPPLVFSGLLLVRQLSGVGETEESTRVALKKLFQFLHQTTQALADIPCAETAFRLFLQCAQAASDCKQEPVAYEFMERAFEIFEESIPDSKAQVTALQLIVGSLQRCTVFGTENRAALVHKATGYSAKLLKKPDQCRAVYMCAHLFWHDTVQELCDAASVLQCLKRALKIANAAQQMAGSAKDAGPAGLFIEILNKYLFFFDKGCESITAEVLQNLLQLVADEVSRESAPPELVSFHRATLAHCRAQKAKGGDIAERYAALTV